MLLDVLDNAAWLAVAICAYECLASTVAICQCIDFARVDLHHAYRMTRDHMRNLMTQDSCNLGLHGRPLQQLQQAAVHNHFASWHHKGIDLIAVNDSKLPF